MAVFLAVTPSWQNYSASASDVRVSSARFASSGLTMRRIPPARLRCGRRPPQSS